MSALDDITNNDAEGSMQDGKRLHGRTIVITGGARGQGAAEAAALLEQGAAVVVTDIVDEVGQSLAEGLSSLGRCEYRHLDITSVEDWQALATSLAQEGRVVHGLINNAGAPQRGRILDIPLEGWNRGIAVNLTGAMLGIQHVASLMTEGGSILNVGSIAALSAHHQVSYTAAKWGLRGLTKVAALELAPLGIRVNIVHPGFIDTEINSGAPQKLLDTQLSLTPAGRPAQPAEIAHLAVYLMSPESSFLTGAEIPFDGGYSSHGGAKVILDSISGTTPSHRSEPTPDVVPDELPIGPQ
ncbi:SDR family NAD(P)-dependent oxidoreductase [Pseudonocardia pini]|uniref:SDR family NAD(P)-dependent oxidoreductase n=1 Tax=Pseudonocardia pini TaxID=2758030 RepID=UPI001C68AEE6|nr:SDR family oxidoreductase [Pseudonocardia pini]